MLCTPKLTPVHLTPLVAESTSGTSCPKYIWACLFRLFAASGHQKLLRTVKRSVFQPASIKFVGAKTIQNQHKHIIGWFVVIVGIRHFLDPEPYEQLYLPPHVIVMILIFSPQSDSPYSQIFRKAGQKKAEPNMSIASWEATASPATQHRKFSITRSLFIQGCTCTGCTLKRSISDHSGSRVYSGARVLQSWLRGEPRPSGTKKATHRHHLCFQIERLRLITISRLIVVGSN
jgi:hypothetical protein